MTKKILGGAALLAAIAIGVSKTIETEPLQGGQRVWGVGPEFDGGVVRLFEGESPCFREAAKTSACVELLGQLELDGGQ